MAKETTDSPQVSMSIAEMQAMITASVSAAVAEMKKPSEYEQEKLDKERAQRERAKIEAFELAKVQDDAKKSRQANCSHLKENGRPRLVGQVFSDGLARAICQNCHMHIATWKATTEQIQSGLDLDIRHNLTLNQLRAMQEVFEKTEDGQKWIDKKKRQAA